MEFLWVKDSSLTSKEKVSPVCLYGIDGYRSQGIHVWMTELHNVNQRKNPDSLTFHVYIYENFQIYQIKGKRKYIFFILEDNFLFILFKRLSSVHYDYVF